jgi:hypothetical protein
MDSTLRYYPGSRLLDFGDRSALLTAAESALFLAAATAGKHGITWEALAERVRRPSAGASATYRNHMRQVLHNLRATLRDAGIPIAIDVVTGMGVVCRSDIEIVSQLQQEPTNGQEAEGRVSE